LTQEGWAFRNRRNEPRPITKDDVRRVRSNWREYAGLAPVGRAKDKNASMLDNPAGELYDTGRAVFDLDLLRAVASVQEKRSVTLRPSGSIKVAREYALSYLLYCAHCEQQAVKYNDARFRSRISGADQYGKLRYRHAEGRNCNCKQRSVFIEVIENDFEQLMSLLTVDSEAI
jgi:hypothetical protein